MIGRRDAANIQVHTADPEQRLIAARSAAIEQRESHLASFAVGHRLTRKLRMGSIRPRVVAELARTRCSSSTSTSRMVGRQHAGEGCSLPKRRPGSRRAELRERPVVESVGNAIVMAPPLQQRPAQSIPAI